MTNLIAYIPVLNKRHLDWFAQHQGSNLYLISQEMAVESIPRLARNMGTVPTETMLRMLISLSIGKVEVFRPFDELQLNLLLNGDEKYIFPDEEVSHGVAEIYFEGRRVEFEMIWARFDMTSISRAHQVVSDTQISSAEFDRAYMQQAVNVSGKSPDWWRQVGAVLVCDGVVVASACNVHMPTEYEVYMFGDPRTNYDAGQPGKYASLHAERGVIAACAASPYSTWGSSLYVTTFPCEDCAREIAACGVARVFFKEGYSSLNAQEVLQAGGVEIIQVI